MLPNLDQARPLNLLETNQISQLEYSLAATTSPQLIDPLEELLRWRSRRQRETSPIAEKIININFHFVLHHEGHSVRVNLIA